MIGSIRDFQGAISSKGPVAVQAEHSSEVKTDAIIEMMSRGTLHSHHLHRHLLLNLQKVSKVVNLLATHLPTQTKRGSQK